MTSLRKKVTSYFRQLSFHNEPRERKSNVNENSFITKYLTGQTKLKDGPPVLYGKSPNDLPNFEIGAYMTGAKIVGCSTGPNGGLTTVRRIEKHLSITDPDIDFIDTQEELAETIKHKSPIRNNASKRPLDNTTMVIKVAGQEYKVTNRKSRSLGSLTDLTLSHEDSCTSSSMINNAACNNNTSPPLPPPSIVTDNNNELSEQCKNQKPHHQLTTDCDDNRKQKKFSNNCDDATKSEHVNRNFSLSKSKSECNPFEHRKKGKIIRLTERPQTQQDSHRDTGHRSTRNTDDPLLPKHWNRKTDYVYGISDSLYDTNQVTKNKNGNPIADCYGIIAREDSAILALADGVNWGEKACVAAKSAIHGCLHYLNKTIFDDTSLFDIDFATKSDSNPQFYDSQNSPINTSYISPPPPPDETEPAPVATAESNENRVTNTTEVFISLLRAFNCAHNLILENQGMLTTLTVAVVLPLKSSHYQQRQTESSDSSSVLTQELNLPRRKRSATGQQNNSDFCDRNNDESKGEKYICCVCNVGDTLAYVYSPKYGVRELTKGSHDVYCNRDMRDALGALGPVDGINPELNNLTLSVTTLDAGDIVMVASDGLTDNYDPTVCKFTVNTPITERTKAERQHLGAHGKEMPSVKPIITPAPRHPRRVSSSGPKPPKVVTPSNVSRLASKDLQSSASSSSKTDLNITKNKENTPSSSDICDNPLVAQFLADNALEKKSETCKPQLLSSHKPTTTTSHHHHQQQQHHHQKRVPTGLSENKNKTLNPLSKSSSVSGVFKSKTTTFSAEPKYSFLRSKTSLEIAPPQKIIHRNEDGLPYVTPIQKYELTLLLIEDILKRGISGKERECTTAKTLCENLFRYTVSITAAKRHTLEDVDLYFDNKNDILIEVSQKEKKMRRKRCLEKVQNLPGKLDHVSVVAYNVGNRIVEFC